MGQVVEVNRFATWISAALETSGLTRTQLSSKADVSTRAIRRLERGEIEEPRPRTYRKLAAAAGYDPDDVEDFLNGETEDGPLPIVSAAVPQKESVAQDGMPTAVRQELGELMREPFTWGALSAGALLLCQMEPAARREFVGRVMHASVTGKMADLIAAARSGKLLD